jgi:hypothetical protein
MPEQDKMPFGKEIAIASFLILFFLTLGTASMIGRSLTYDESGHFQYGLNLLNGNSTRFDDSKMPISAWNAIPQKIVSYLPQGNTIKYWLQKYQTARLMTLIFSATIALLVYLWSRKLYGVISALITLLLYVLDPNILAHSQLITTDVYAMGVITLVFFCLSRFANHRNWLNGIIYSLVLGFSLIAKYTTVVLLPISVISLILYDFPTFRNDYQKNAADTIKKSLYRYTGYIVLACLVSILVVNIAFIFNRTFTPFGGYKFRSELFQSIQARFPILSNLIIPTPYPYLEGLDWVIQRERTGEGYGSPYMLGIVNPRGKGFPGYYFIASLFKVPITSQLIILLSLIVYIKDNKRRARFLKDEQFLLIPVILFSVYFNFFYNTQIGIRHYLIVFPLLYIFAGNLFVNWMNLAKWQKALFYLSVGYLAISVLSYFPYYITYFNELVPDKNTTYKFLSDSNLDYGQDRYQLDAYLKEHPDALVDVDYPRAGHFIIPANRLTGVALGIKSDPKQYEWLRKNFEPIGTVANYYFIFKISSEEINHLCQTTDYCK